MDKTPKRGIHTNNEQKVVDTCQVVWDQIHLTMLSFTTRTLPTYLNVFLVWKPTLNKNFDASSVLNIASCSASGD